MLFHITSRAAWQHAVATGVYDPRDGETFIHLSTEAQWPATRERFFTGIEDLVLLVIDPERLVEEVRWESAHDEVFPHLYGVLEIGAVVEVREL
ncbi:MAG: DUF952 domain-containing protein [Kofleriaceae bacterium]